MKTKKILYAATALMMSCSLATVALPQDACAATKTEEKSKFESFFLSLKEGTLEFFGISVKTENEPESTDEKEINAEENSTELIEKEESETAEENTEIIEEEFEEDTEIEDDEEDENEITISEDDVIKNSQLFGAKVDQLIPDVHPDTWTGNFSTTTYVTAWVIENENLDYLKCPDELNWETKTSCE